MLVASIFLWAFIASSLLLCTVFLKEYETNRSIGRVVLGSSLAASTTVSALMTVLARRFAAPRALGAMTDGPYRDAKLGSAFLELSAKMGVRNAELLQAKLGNAFSLTLKGKRLVAVSPLLIQGLSSEEAEAVLAHELSHIKNRDSWAKGLARFARFAFPFDLVIRLAEAALHRERELLADSSSVRFTGKPLALASALIKVHSANVPATEGMVAGLFVGGKKNGLLSRYPNLERRIELLLKLAKTTRIAIPA